MDKDMDKVIKTIDAPPLNCYSCPLIYEKECGIEERCLLIRRGYSLLRKAYDPPDTLILDSVDRYTRESFYHAHICLLGYLLYGKDKEIIRWSKQIGFSKENFKEELEEETMALLPAIRKVRIKRKANECMNCELCGQNFGQCYLSASKKKDSFITYSYNGISKEHTMADLLDYKQRLLEKRRYQDGLQKN